MVTRFVPCFPPLALFMLLLFSAERHDLAIFNDLACWKIRPNGLRDIARCQMGVVLLGYAGVGVAELGGDDACRQQGVRVRRRAAQQDHGQTGENRCGLRRATMAQAVGSQN